MRWVQLTLVENDPGRFDPHSGSTTSGACTPMPPRSAPAASSPTTRPRCRCTIGARGSATAIRSASSSRGCRALGMQVLARTDPHAARDDVRAAHPDWIAVDADGAAEAALGQPGVVGHLRARSVQLRVHGRGAPRDRHAVPASTASSRTAGRRRAATATACTAGRTSARRPGWTCRASSDATRPGAARVPRMAEGAADGAVEALGRHGARRAIPRRGSFRTARPISRPPASWPTSSSPTTRRAAA